LNTIRFIITPQPSTNNKDGFHSLPKPKNPSIFDLLTIPETRSPEPKMTPTIQVII
jgi:hypothetical protein